MSDPYDTALELAGELLGRPLELPLGPESPRADASSAVSPPFTRSATAGPGHDNSIPVRAA
jgi:hypothetical protein